MEGVRESRHSCAMKHFCKLLFLVNVGKYVISGPEEGGHPWALKSITIIYNSK